MINISQTHFQFQLPMITYFFVSNSYVIDLYSMNWPVCLVKPERLRLIKVFCCTLLNNPSKTELRCIKINLILFLRWEIRQSSSTSIMIMMIPYEKRYLQAKFCRNLVKICLA